MSGVRWFVAACLTLLCVAGATRVDAQDDTLSAEARQRFELAREAFEREDFAIALAEFERVYGLIEGNPRRPLLLYNIARCHEELGRSADAVTFYERFLAESGDDAPNRPEAQQHLNELRLRVRLARGSETGPGPAPATAVSPVGPIVLATGGAALLAGAIVGAISLAQADSFTSMCSDLSACAPALRPQYDEMRTFSAVADVMLVSGALIAITGLVLTLTVQEASSDTSTAAACTADGCSVLVAGRW